MSDEQIRTGGAIVPVTASDTVDIVPPEAYLGKTPRALLVGTAGAATIVDGMGETRTLIPLQLGYNPIQVRRVFATGLTAANIWAIF